MISVADTIRSAIPKGFKPVMVEANHENGSLLIKCRSLKDKTTSQIFSRVASVLTFGVCPLCKSDMTPQENGGFICNGGKRHLNFIFIGSTNPRSARPTYIPTRTDAPRTDAHTRDDIKDAITQKLKEANL